MRARFAIRIPFLPLAALLLLGAPWLLRADEGEWLPEQIQDLDFAALEARGLELAPDELWDGEEGLLSAAVQINGCSSSFVSEQGLIVTNHHCGFAAINAVSSLEENYLEEGFVAGSPEAEIPAPGYVVSFVRRYEDVTAEIRAVEEAAGDDPAERWRAVQAKRRELEEEARGPDSSAIVVPYFKGREWRRIWRTVLRDVRLVYAPPRDVGEYGGETDNWMWPRHTGDFCFFRAYVAPDGSPADYAEENVPFSPPRWLEVSPEGIDPGDLVMILGYPGRTRRYETSVAVAAREAVYYPMRLELFQAAMEAYRDLAASDEQIGLRLQSRIKSFANVEKNARGMLWGLERNRVVAQKEAEEEGFRAWVQDDAARERRWGGVLDEMLALDVREAARMDHDFVLEQLQRRSLALRRALNAARAGNADAVGGFDELAGWEAPADRRILETLFAMADGLPEEQRIEGYDRWRDGGGGLDDLGSLAGELQPEIEELSEFRDEMSGRRLAVGPRWIEAQEAWRGERFYPDANSTLRLSIATVKGYEPRDGVWHSTHTTVDGMLRKHTGEGEFDVPDAIFAAVEQDPAARDIPVCFLADGDTTGGNSGSPVVDGKGRLVGLNFDRVYENVAGDFWWTPERSRNISVDLQYVLWLMREVWPAPRLLEEMGLGR